MTAQPSPPSTLAPSWCCDAPVEVVAAPTSADPSRIKVRCESCAAVAVRRIIK